MAPKAAVLESALVDAAHEIFRADPANLSVNAVRKHVEDDLGLEDGFFKNGIWKVKSKELITDTASKLLEDNDKDEAADEEEAKPRKKAARETKTKPKATKAKRVPNAVPADKDTSSDGDSVTTPVKEPSRKRKLPKKNVAESSAEEEEESNDIQSLTGKDGDVSEGLVVRKKPKLDKEVHSGSAAKAGPKPQDGTHESVDAAHDSDGSSTSVLEDSPPKRKDKPAKRASAKSSTKPAAKPAKKAVSAIDSPDQAEVKKLQGHLVKCGVRKIWGVELKPFGDDVKAKIRHLKKMLHDVGMDGRFSETRAREIKERRELMNDLEDVQEMNRHWGLDGSGRASRSRAAKTKTKTLKEESSDDEDGDGGKADKEDNESDADVHNRTSDAEDDEDDDDGPTAGVKGSRAVRQDLAFLGSESESDSD